MESSSILNIIQRVPCSHPIIPQNSMMSSMSQIITITSHFLRPKVPMRIGFCVGDSSRGNVEVDGDVGNIWLAG